MGCDTSCDACDAWHPLPRLVAIFPHTSPSQIGRYQEGTGRSGWPAFPIWKAVDPVATTVMSLVMQMVPNMQNWKDLAQSQHSPFPFFPKKITVDKGTSVDTRSYKKTEINPNLRVQCNKKKGQWSKVHLCTPWSWRSWQPFRILSEWSVIIY
jgi:hypothetical protein